MVVPCGTPKSSILTGCPLQTIHFWRAIFVQSPQIVKNLLHQKNTKYSRRMVAKNTKNHSDIHDYQYLMSVDLLLVSLYTRSSPIMGENGINKRLTTCVRQPMIKHIYIYTYMQISQLYCGVLSCTVLYCILLYYIMLCYIISCYVLSYYIWILYCDVILFDFRLYSEILYFIISYHIILNTSTHTDTNKHD